MPSYMGYCKSQLDCLVLFEAARQRLIPKRTERLSEEERQNIRSGAIYIWDEEETGIKRWTDGKSWSTSRVLCPFLVYRELENVQTTDTSNGCRVKPYGLCKQSTSITFSPTMKLHLIGYYRKKDVRQGKLVQPTVDLALKQIVPIVEASQLNKAEQFGGTTKIPPSLAPPQTTALYSHPSSLPSYDQQPPNRQLAAISLAQSFQTPPSPNKAGSTYMGPWPAHKSHTPPSIGHPYVSASVSGGCPVGGPLVLPAGPPGQSGSGPGPANAQIGETGPAAGALVLQNRYRPALSPSDAETTETKELDSLSHAKLKLAPPMLALAKNRELLFTLPSPKTPIEGTYSYSGSSEDRRQLSLLDKLSFN